MSLAEQAPRPAPAARGRRPGGSRPALARVLAAAAPAAAGSLPVVVTFTFAGLPIVLAVLYTFGYRGWLNQAVADLATHQVTAHHGLTLRAWQLLFAEPGFLDSLWTTGWVTLASTALLVLVSWAIALYLRLATGFGRRLVAVLFVVPMFVPIVISSYALLTFWQDNGRLAGLVHPLGLHQLNLPGGTNLAVVLGLVWSNLPFGVLLITAGLHSVPQAYVDAARDAAASWPMIIRTVLFPLAKLPTLVVITFVATGSLGTYTIPFIIGPSAPATLGVTMTNSFVNYGQPQAAEIIAVLVFLLAAVFSVLYVRASVTEVRRLERRP